MAIWTFSRLSVDSHLPVAPTTATSRCLRKETCDGIQSETTAIPVVEGFETASWMAIQQAAYLENDARGARREKEISALREASLAPQLASYLVYASGPRLLEAPRYGSSRKHRVFLMERTGSSNLPVSIFGGTICSPKAALR